LACHARAGNMHIHLTIIACFDCVLTDLWLVLAHGHRCNRYWRWTWETKLRTWPRFSKRSTVSWTARMPLSTRPSLNGLQSTRSTVAMYKILQTHKVMHHTTSAPMRPPTHTRPRRWRPHRVWKLRIRYRLSPSSLHKPLRSGTILLTSSLPLTPKETAPRLRHAPLLLKADTHPGRQCSHRQRYCRHGLCTRTRRVCLAQDFQGTMEGGRILPTDLQSDELPPQHLRGCRRAPLPRTTRQGAAKQRDAAR